MKYFTVIITVVLFAGCNMTRDSSWYENATLSDVCSNASQTQYTSLETVKESIQLASNELVRRGFSEKEINYINQSKVYIGMPEQSVECAKGSAQRINRTSGSWGVHKQFVYENSYVYVENGLVTSTQD